MQQSFLTYLNMDKQTLLHMIYKFDLKIHHCKDYMYLDYMVEER